MNWHTAESEEHPSKPGHYRVVIKGGEVTMAEFKWFSLGEGTVAHPWWSRNIVAWEEHPTDVPDFSKHLDLAALTTRAAK